MLPYIVKRSKTSGLGLFAVRDIKKGEFIIEYIGKILSAEEYANARENRYMFELNSKVTIDGSTRSNTARYLNHACKPNCEIRTGKKIKFYARKAIPKGEELTINYGKDYFNEYIRPTGCHCTSCTTKATLGRI